MAMLIRDLGAKWPGLQKKAIWLWPLLLLAAIGLTRAILTHNIWFNFEDQSTFFIFGHNVLHGEVIYKDFIHFRTPGLYFLSAAFQWAFGQTLATEQLLLALESYLFYPVLLYIAAWLITRRRWVAFSLGLMAAWLPGLLQDRAGLALLTVAVYMRSLSAANPKQERRWLLLTGLLLGATFTFGQDSAIIAIGVLGLCELRFKLARPRLLLTRVGSLAIGAVAALLPLLAYVVFLSNIKNFLYYVFKYALVIQPTGMNLPFPSLVPPNQDHVMFYIPFLILLASFAVFYLADDLNIINLPVLVLATLSLVTPLGRADQGHVIYALPLTLLLVPLAATSVAKMRFTRGKVLAVSVWLIVAIVLIRLATTRSSFAIAGVAMLFVAASISFRRSDLSHGPIPSFIFSQDAVALAFTGWTLVVLAYIWPIYGYAWGPLKYGWERKFGPNKERVTPAHTVSGVPVDGPAYLQLQAVSRLVDQYHPSVLFSYPIQPFYYSLVPHHATRFMTFEPETTAEEQAETIEDLKRNRPQLVIMDSLQADGLEKSVGDINKYIKENFEPVAEVNYTRPLVVLVPRH
jgi:hypothetical protein